jgi:polysaccharide deacetylase family protein (PEP-CTERM system associated)
VNILTFDIEDWFHTHQNRQYYSGHIWSELPSRVVNGTNLILDMLEETGLKATFFILGWVAEHHPLLVKKIYSKGHEIGVHSHWHHNPHFLSQEDFEKDLKLCLDKTQELTGEKITAYRAPGFNLNFNDNWAFNILANNGILVDSSIQTNKITLNPPVEISTSKGKILEFPLITTYLGIPYSGGGYFRALPDFVTKYYFDKRKYNLLYFHPRDFDKDYPVSNLFSLSRNILNMVNTKKNKTSLLKLLQEIETCTLKEAVLNYEKTK